MIKTVDKLLRGEFTSSKSLRDDGLAVSVRTLVLAGLVLGGIYGVFMGLFGALRSEGPSVLQLVVTTVKVPLLFLLTLVVTFPSLYVASALAGFPFRSKDTLKLLLVAAVVNLALLASFGPVTGFFTLSTESYPFMIILNVMFFTIGGLAGLIFLWKALNAVFEAGDSEPEAASPPPVLPETSVPEKSAPETSVPEKSASESESEGESPPPAASTSARPPVRRTYAPPPQVSSRVVRVKFIFVAWTMIYAVVGAQMGWILRPFIGSPGLPFTLFRQRDSNFFEALGGALLNLLAG